MMKRSRLFHLAIESGLNGVVLVFLFPILLVLYNSLKSFGEVMRNVMALPHRFAFENYSYVWKYMDYPRLFLNNVLVTAIGTVGILVISSIAAYKLSRTRSKLSAVLYFLIIVPMLIPFQSIMVTVLKLARELHLANSIWGLGVQYWGLGAPLAVFIYHGFVKGIPRELDESATIDGASGFSLFFRIIFPLLKPVTATVAVLDIMWIWNDFLLPLLMVNGSASTKTLTLAAYSFVGQYNTDWQYTMTALVMAVLPSIIVFVLLQKHIVKGVTAGAVKG